MIQFRGEVGPDGVPHFPPGKIRPITSGVLKHQTGKEIEVIFSSKAPSTSSK